jgi:hypothetical protein
MIRAILRFLGWAAVILGLIYFIAFYPVTAANTAKGAGHTGKSFLSGAVATAAGLLDGFNEK